MEFIKELALVILVVLGVTYFHLWDHVSRWISIWYMNHGGF